MDDDYSDDEAYVSPLEEIESILKLLSELKPMQIIYGKDKKTSMGTSMLQSNKDSLFEDEVPSTVRRLSEAGFLAITELNMKDGLLNLRKAEMIINVINFYFSLFCLFFFKFDIFFIYPELFSQ